MTDRRKIIAGENSTIYCDDKDEIKALGNNVHCISNLDNNVYTVINKGQCVEFVGGMFWEGG